MATYDIVFNVAKGRERYYADQVISGGTKRFVAIPIEASGIVSADTMKDYTTVAALLAGASNEQTTMGRQTLTTVATSQDDTNNWVLIDADNPVWTGTSGNSIAAVVIAYDADNTSGTDSDLVPVVCLDMVAAPSGAITLNFNALGFCRVKD